MDWFSGRVLIPERLYHGCAKIMRHGDQLGPDARITTDAAQAVLDSWRDAEITGTTPHLYEVGEGLIIDAVFPTGDTTWRAVLMVREDWRSAGRDGERNTPPRPGLSGAHSPSHQ